MSDNYGWIIATVVAALYAFAYYTYADNNESVSPAQPIQLIVIAAGMLWMVLSDASTASVIVFCVVTVFAFAGNLYELDKQIGKAILFTLWQICAVWCVVLVIIIIIYMLYSATNKKRRK